MLSNFIVCFKAVLPIYILLAVGYGVRKFKVLSEKEIKDVNHMIFVVFFPVLMFDNIYGADFSEAFHGKMVAFAVLYVMAVYLVTTVVVLAIEKRPKSRGALIQAIYRSNFVILGLPLTQNLFGDSKLAKTAVLITVIVPLYNILAVFTLEIYRGGKVRIGKMLLNVLKNPIIIGAIVAIAATLVGLKVPAVLDQLIGEMADTTTIMALVILGASFDIHSISGELRNLTVGVVGRLLVVPGIGLTLAMLIGLRGVEFVSLLAMLATPTAISSFTMAQSMDSDSELAGNCVIFSSLFSLATMLLWMFLFKNLGMF